MKVENVYPEYKDVQEREKNIQEVYTELQAIFYNRDGVKKKMHSRNQEKDNMPEIRKGN